MIKEIDNIIDKLIYNANTSRGTEIAFKNLYKDDKDFIYIKDKENKEVIVTYKSIKYAFTLPVIPCTLKPPISWLWFKRAYIHNMINTFELDYSLSMYYAICIHTYYKNNIIINIKNN